MVCMQIMWTYYKVLCVFVHTPTDRKKESTIIFVSSGRWNSLGLTSLLGLTALLLFCYSSRCNSSHLVIMLFATVWL